MSGFISRSQQQRDRLMQMFIKRNAHSGDRPAEKGLTIIECLVAIFVIGLTVTLITPPIFIAAATRAQNRRAEQALQIAQGEVDRIRVMVARGTHTVAVLPNIVAEPLQNTAPPNGLWGNNVLKTSGVACAGITRYNDGPIAIDKGLMVDVDGDCQADFFMQVFRTQGTITADQAQRNAGNLSQAKPSDFQLGVRVYAMLASGTRPGNSWANLRREPASLKLTNGEGNQRTRPLAVIYTSFAWSDQSNTLCDYFQDINPAALPNNCVRR
jgi:type II secretory pathway pseudopilin PulG